MDTIIGPAEPSIEDVRSAEKAEQAAMAPLGVSPAQTLAAHETAAAVYRAYSSAHPGWDAGAEPEA